MKLSDTVNAPSVECLTEDLKEIVTESTSDSDSQIDYVLQQITVKYKNHKGIVLYFV